MKIHLVKQKVLTELRCVCYRHTFPLQLQRTAKTLFKYDCQLEVFNR